MSSEMPSDRRLVKIGGGSANVLQRHAQSLCKRCDRDVATARKDGDRLEIEVGWDEFERSGRHGLRTMAGDVHLLGHSRSNDLEKLDRSGRMSEQGKKTSATSLAERFIQIRNVPNRDGVEERERHPGKLRVSHSMDRAAPRPLRDGVQFAAKTRKKGCSSEKGFGAREGFIMKTNPTLSP